MIINNYSTWNFYHDFKKDPVHLFAYYQNVFSKKECETIIQIGKDFVSEAVTRNETSSEVRLSETSWFFPQEEYEWIFSRISNVIVDLNNRFFGFDLHGLHEGIQFTKYTAPGGKYGQHIDSAYGTEIRKLSFTLQLSDPEDYEGGELCLYNGGPPNVMSKEQGYVALFPSYVLHEVTPVTRGTRYSLVSWVTGKPFR